MFSKFHIEKDVHRHWCPYSEPFTGGDALQSSLDQGWAIVGSITIETYELRESRKINVFHVRLHNDGHFRVMRVIANPFVERLIENAGYLIENHNVMVEVRA